MSYRIQLRDDANWRDRYYWWVLKSAGNGVILATSETYTTKRKAVKTAQALAKALDIEVEFPL